ncbi:alpha 1,6 mannopyranosyltransferase [Corynebacterium sp. HMSC22B11]|uniref:alpha-(1->6)-mannopyranosyltransferase A n=1 Tax=Corynebacterium sp. HMSC22B11 TaxID=1581056 RepID=UPI0008A50DD1|nr:alpha-(1->6)-mannopyranosyltransferase A [Corynebacterium sp. HMSC22B11]OFO16279.1 alpha 1,6 mannopyranosyltransferase [Corynebacterium sp. HMSC22B11]
MSTQLQESQDKSAATSRPFTEHPVVARPTAWLRAHSMSSAIRMGLIGSVVLTLCSYTVGATRERGGIMQALGLDWLTFGHMAGIFSVVLWVGIALLVLSWAIVGGLVLRGGRSLPQRAIAAWVGPMVLAAPLMSRDIYSYLMQGALAKEGLDAYRVGAAANPGPMLYEVSADWRNTTTPYGPGHLWLGKGVTTITGDNVTAGIFVFKFLTLVAFVALIWVVRHLAAELGSDPDLAVWLGVANPLVIVHLIGGLHTESMMMALVILGILASLRLRPVAGLLLGSVLIAAGVALKATAAIALPFLIWIAVARIAGPAPRGWFKETAARFVTLLWTGISSVAVVVAVMFAITWASGQTWGWIAEMSGNSKVINPLAAPTMLASTLEPFISRINDDIGFNVLIGIFRPISMVIMLIGLVVVWWLFRHDVRRALLGATLAYAVTCVFNSVVLPWYYVAPLVIVGVCIRDRRAVFIVAWLSAVLCFMFDGGGNNRLYVLWWVIAIGVVMWFALRATLGFAPGMPEEQAEPWPKAAKSEPSPAPGGEPREPSARAAHQPADQAGSRPR